MTDDRRIPRCDAVRLLAWVVATALTAVVAGTWAGQAAYRQARQAGPAPDDQTGFEDLGYAFAGLLVGFGVGILVYVVGTVAGVRRTVPPGRRLGTAVAILACTAAVPFFVGPVVSTAQRGGMVAFGALAAVALVLAMGGFVGLLVDAVGPRLLARLGAVAAAASAVVILVGGQRAERIGDDRRADRYEEVGAPLALVGGRDLRVPAAGWELVSVGSGWRPDGVAVTFDTPALDGYPAGGWVELVMEPDGEPPRCVLFPAGSEEACVELGRRDDGAVILGEPITGYDDVSGIGEVWVDVPGGRWTIDGTNVPQPIDVEAAVAILRALEPVDAGTFVAASSPSCRRSTP